VVASPVDYNTVKVTWDAADGASKYNVYCAKGEGAYKLKASTTKTSYTTGWNLQPGAEYHFIVTTGTLSSGSSAAATLSSTTETAVNGASATTLLSQTTMKAYGTSSSTAKIAWSKVKGASYYRVYRKNSSGNWVRVKSTSSLSYTNSGLKSSTTYTYTVRAVRKTSKYTSTRIAANSDAAKTSAYDARAKIMSVAKSKLGCKYVWGAEGPSAFDCSGYVYYVYAHANASTKTFGRSTAQAYYSSMKSYNIGTSVSKASKGDILLIGSSKSNIVHTGLYYGDGKMIHASSTWNKVTVTPTSYYHIVAILHLPMK
jgi:cell wall-associated NlpC family hydrolase